MPHKLTPSRLPLQVLDLRGNDLRVLSNEAFVTAGITNVQRFYCSDCRLSEVEPRAFNRYYLTQCGKR